MLPVCNSLQEAIEVIRRSPIPNLRSEAWMEHELLPSLGLHDQGTWPKHLKKYQGKGLRSWQWPNQFARYLVRLSTFREIDSYLEIGLSHGGTFVITCEYLKRFNTSFEALGVDMEIKSIVREYGELENNVTLIEASSRSREVISSVSQRMWGLALIDGDHSEEGCWQDYLATKDYIQLAAFHDITNDVFPGVGAVWSKVAAVLPRSRTWEFTEQYPEIMRDYKRVDYGIGLAEVNPVSL